MLGSNVSRWLEPFDSLGGCRGSFRASFGINLGLVWVWFRMALVLKYSFQIFGAPFAVDVECLGMLCALAGMAWA